MTRVLLMMALAISGLTIQATEAHANRCGAAARQIVSGMPRGTLLSVRVKTNKKGRTVCVVRVKVAGKNGKPPRVVVRRFAP